MSKIAYEDFKKLKEKFSDLVTSDTVFEVVFDLVFGLDNIKEIKILKGDNSDTTLEGFISFMLSRDFKGSRFTKEIKLFIEKLDKLYSCGINDCKPAFETLVKAIAEDCILNGEATVDSVHEIVTALLSVGIIETDKVLNNETEKASSVLAIAAILTSIIAFFTKSGL